MLKEGAFKGDCATRLKSLAAEIPSHLICCPNEISGQGGLCSEEDSALFNAEWKGWTEERAKGDWTVALPLISTEMYLYRRVLDATGYFGQGETGGLDPYQSQKDSALASALSSKAFLSAVKMRGSTGEFVDRALLLADLWGNQGDLALTPLDQSNTDAAHKIGNGDGPEKDALLVDESEAALKYLALLGGKARIDFVLDNSGIELLCDFVLADHLLSSGLAEQVVLHSKGEPLFVSDAMPKDIESHVAALEAHSDEGARALGASLRAHAQSGALVVESHMFWTAPRLFWEMPKSLAKHLSASSLIIVKGDANYRRLVGDRVWPHTTPLSDVVLPWFPAPLLALRTLKAEIALGLTEGQAEAVGKVYKDWMVTGDFAQVQFVPQPRADGSGERD